jgi:16S rRNA (adenine1518-N6/adenine1519-N6)-dimethyltransferase
LSVPRTRNAVEALLAAPGIFPKRQRGQNFLVDGNLIDAIVRDAGVEQRHAVLEVGTGTGILTAALAPVAGAVVSCDIDPGLQRITRGLIDWPGNVNFIAADVLDGKHALNAEVVAAWRAPGLALKVVSNLPYNIATPFLANLLWSDLPFEDATVLVQREAAERFTARVGTSEYGPMAISIGLLANARIVRDVHRQVFWPQPKVESALLRIEARDRGRASVLREAGLPDLLQRAFLHRRKVLRRLVAPERLAAAGLPEDVRPEGVAPEQWVALCDGETGDRKG